MPASDDRQRGHGVIVRPNLRVPMRDGVELSADVFLPAGAAAGQSFPAIVQRTPYDNGGRLYPEFNWVDVAKEFAGWGYAFVSQDVRGRGDSDGQWTPFLSEPEDGHDTIEWVAAQPWCNGKTGMMGGSYGGFVQWMAARERPPHLTTLVSTAAFGRLMQELPYFNGKVMPVWAMWWLNQVAGRTRQPDAMVDVRRVVETFPSREVDVAVGRPNPVWREWLRHPTFDEYWQRIAMQGRFAAVDLPVLHITGWFDGDQWGQLYYWKGMAADSPARNRQYLIAGPWDHGGTRTPRRRLGGLDFGHGALMDMMAVHRRWFDFWLKGEGETPVDFAPGARSRIFVMGTNRWRDDPTWPPPAATETRLFFRSGGRANTLGGDGRLDAAAPAAGEGADEYTYNPDDPTPSAPDPLGGATDFDERWLLRRDDVVVYTSAPLDHPVEITGHAQVVVYAETDVPDTDFAAALHDVYPDGRSVALTHGIVRASYRDDPGAPSATPLQPGTAYCFRIELRAISAAFREGHRIRVAVMSASWPAYDRNPNTGAPQGDDLNVRVAHQRILHDAAHPSHLLAPVVPSA